MLKSRRKKDAVSVPVSHDKTDSAGVPFRPKMGYTPKPDATDPERLASVETILCDMHSRLFGNGQPGEIEHIKSRVNRLEQWMWRGIGAAALLAVLGNKAAKLLGL